ncbi:TetR/AcrR family transcriptional regulator [Micromonospora sonneratiae]|uniref:TetR/AcrR family transcriptional regulator n=1 Tax=Micromonospora sonneratiae TaxID=1184706 RepID=A0ABW3YPL4_9ACTN
MEDDSAASLPPGIEAAWGLRERPPKGPKRSLSLPQIVDAAIRVADSEGLAAVSMSRVATELGAAPMSLYRYVVSKDELLVLMVDAAYGKPPTADGPDEGWRAELARWAWAEREALRRHPWVLRVPISGPPATPNNLLWLEAGLHHLRDTGLTATEKLSAILLLTGYVRNTSTLAVDLDAAAQTSGTTLSQTVTGYTRLLRSLIDPQRFPQLSSALEAEAFGSDGDLDDEFAFGLERVLDGVAALVQARD